MLLQMRIKVLSLNSLESKQIKIPWASSMLKRNIDEALEAINKLTLAKDYFRG